MADVSTEITPVEIDDLYEETTIDFTDCTSDSSADDTEDVWFEIPEGRRGIQRILVLIREEGNQSGLAAEFQAGDHWAAKDVEVDITENKINAIMIETAKHLDSDGEIHCVLTPNSGDKIVTDHDVSVAVVYLY